MKSIVVSEMDVEHLKVIRSNVVKFLKYCAEQYDAAGPLLDIAPQEHPGAAPYFTKSKISTLDIDPTSEATYIADICRRNHKIIPANFFDRIICTEVLEHTLNPFAAIQEIYRMLQKNGLLFLTTPFNFRIHGPAPDCWRFTEQGLKTLLYRFEIIELQAIATPGRDLMPVHYTVVARKISAYAAKVKGIEKEKERKGGNLKDLP